MHIAVNARLLLHQRLEGLGRFSNEVLSRLVQASPNDRFSFFFDRPYHPSFIYAKNVEPFVLFPQARHPLLYLLWFEGTVANKLARLKPDVFFSPDGFLSLGSSIRQVPVIHDIAFEHYPNDIAWVGRTYYRTMFPRFARKAAHILTVSEFTKQDIIQHYGTASEKITVIGNGCSSTFSPSDKQTQIQTRNQFTQGQPYFLYAGAIQPRKNLEQLLKAYNRFRTDSPDAPVKLVLTGRKAWQFEQVITYYQSMSFHHDVIFTGYVDDVTLNRLYGAAYALCYVSKFEGFGLPIIEAMRAGTAVIASNTTAMPEAGGQAALYINPDQEESITQAMKTLWFNPALRQNLVDLGLTHAHNPSFDWQLVADKTKNCLQKMAHF